MTCEPTSTEFQPTTTVHLADTPTDIRMIIDRADPTRLQIPDHLAQPLLARGAVHRIRNPDLWDAWIVATLRQNTRTTTANQKYQALCETHGHTLPTPDGPTRLPPPPEVLLGLTDNMFTSLGMRHRRRPLQAAAQAYLKHHEAWHDLSPRALLTELQTTPYVGEWTARVIVADLTNDFSIYPYTEHAIRTWGDEFAAATHLPRGETPFAHTWRTLHGEQRSTLTLLTMAWGQHHGDPNKLWRSPRGNYATSPTIA